MLRGLQGAGVKGSLGDLGPSCLGGKGRAAHRNGPRRAAGEQLTGELTRDGSPVHCSLSKNPSLGYTYSTWG